MSINSEGKCSSLLVNAGLVLQGPCSLEILSEATSPREPRKRALLIAINYTNLPDRYRLRSPQQEVEELRDLLIEQDKYQLESITILTDKEGTPETHYPSKENILKYLRTFYDDQQPGDHYLFYFAGHSFQHETDDQKEEDRMDEFILPSVNADSETFRKLNEASEKGRSFCEITRQSNDFIDKEAGIIDDVLEEYLVKRLDCMSNLTAIFDTCHSNTLLDLPHYRCNRVYNWKSRLRRVVRRCSEICVQIQEGRFGYMLVGRTMHLTNQKWFCDGFRSRCCRRKDVENNIASILIPHSNEPIR
ncbi:hypothetical protein E4T56_gene20519 [Termitomyces sp. T112]|nr:hypothetical protein E4T56_gene20519 [Termitomyces sp. T112]